MKELKTIVGFDMAPVYVPPFVKAVEMKSSNVLCSSKSQNNTPETYIRDIWEEEIIVEG